MRSLTEMYYLNRTACDVLQEMRKCNENVSEHTVDRNKEVMLYLIEEAQSMYNKMEAGLSNHRDLVSMEEEHSKRRKELKALTKEVGDLKKEAKVLKGEEVEGVDKITSIIEDLSLGEDE